MTYGEAFGWPHRRCALLSFSVKSSSGAPSQCSQYSPRSGCAAWTTHGAACRSDGLRASSPHDQVLRNHRVGRTRSRADFGPAIVDGDADQHVLRTRLGVLDEHVEVAVAVEDAGIEQLVLELLARPAPVGLDQVPVGKLALRVLVQVLHVRVRGRAIEVEVVLLHILAVVALAVGEPEQALLEDRVALVPQRQREAQQLPVVAQSAEPVLAPPVGARTRLVVGEVVPGVAVLAVVLADRAPLPLAEIRSPFLPRDLRLARLVQTRLFRHIHDRRVHACLRCQWVTRGRRNAPARGPPPDCSSPVLPSTPRTSAFGPKRRLRVRQSIRNRILNSPPPDRVFALQRSDRLNRMGTADLVCVRFGKPKVLDLASLDQILHGSSHIFHGHVRIRTVLVEQIDHLDPQTLEGSIRYPLDLFRAAVQPHAGMRVPFRRASSQIWWRSPPVP